MENNGVKEKLSIVRKMSTSFISKNDLLSTALLLGAAYGRAEENLKAFIDKSGLPFLPTPMGKGVVSDLQQQCVSAARSRYVILYWPKLGN